MSELDSRHAERLDAYLDGELGERERSRLEEELARSPELRRGLEARRDLDQALRALPRPGPSPWFEARFRARLAREEEGEETGGIGAKIRSWGWLVAGPAVALAALFMLGNPPLPHQEQDWEIVAGADFELVMEEDPELLKTLDLLELWGKGKFL